MTLGASQEASFEAAFEIWGVMSAARH